MRRLLPFALLAAVVGTASTAGADAYFAEKPAAFGAQPCAAAGCWTNYLQIVDLDGDGDLDVVMPNADGYFVKGPEAQPLLVYLNDGAGNFTDGSQAMVGGTSGWFRQVAFADINGDGRLDAVTGQGESGSFVDRVYLGTALAPVDTHAPGFRAIEQVAAKIAVGSKPVVRFAVFDNATTDTGPRLKKAYVKVTTPDGMTEVPAIFVGGDLFRAELPAQAKHATKVSYEVCATDRRGNDGCAKPKTYVIEGALVENGGIPRNDGGSSGETNGQGPGPEAEGSGTSGCGCDVPAGHANAIGLLSLVALAALVARRRSPAPRIDGDAMAPRREAHPRHRDARRQRLPAARVRRVERGQRGLRAQ